MSDLNESLKSLDDEIEKRVYLDRHITFEDALFLLGGAVFVAHGFQGERDRLGAAYSTLLRAAEELRPYEDEFRFPTGRVDSRVAEAARGIIAALDGTPEDPLAAELNLLRDRYRATWTLYTKQGEVVEAAREFAAANDAWIAQMKLGEPVDLKNDEVLHRRAAATATLCHYVRVLDEDEDEDDGD
jgi:hypothetical protein